ncbi:MAG: hypothetical protein ACFFBP_15380 [Promethearchaeota archaeon]
MKLILNLVKNFKGIIFETVIFKNKKKINASKIFEIIDESFHMELRDIKISIIEYHLKRLNINKSFKNFLFNQLFLLDKGIHRKARLIKYLLDRKIHINKIYAPFLSKNEYSLFAKFNLNVKKLKTTTDIFFPLSMILLIIKVFKIHSKSMKCLPPEKSRFNPKIKYYTLIRAQGERPENIYRNKHNKSLDNTIIQLHPNFDGKYISKQQKNYINYLNKNERNYFFYHQKINYFYTLKKGIKIYFSSFPKNIKKSLFKIIIKSQQIDDLINYLNIQFPDLQECYSIEESRPSSIYLNEKLKKSKIKTINTAHGLGIYAPIVNYDVFYVFSKIQRNFYKGPSEFKYFNSIKQLYKKELSLKKKIALLFICSYTFTPTYKEVISYIEKIAKKNIIQVYAKYHPHTKETDRYLSKNIVIVEDIENLPPDNNYLAVTLYSTYVVELLNKMPFLIINPHNQINMDFIFPPDDFMYVKNYDMFEKIVEKFVRNPKNYIQYWENMVVLFQEYCF